MPETAPHHPTNLPKALPLLPIRDMVVFPQVILPLFVGRDASVRAVEAALATDRLLLLVTQKGNTDTPDADDLYAMGTASSILRTLKMQDGRLKILVQGVMRARITDWISTTPFLNVRISPVEIPALSPLSKEAEALLRTVKEHIQKIVGYGKSFAADMLAMIENLDDPGRLADLIMSHMGGKIEVAQKVLEIDEPVARLRKVNALLVAELDMLSVQHKIHSEVVGEIDKTQREYFLREQMKAIHRELGETDWRTKEARRLRTRMVKAKMPAAVAKEVEEQIKRFERMHPESAEANIILTYLEWMVELPWSAATQDAKDIARAEAILHEDHYGLPKVKERILEYLAVRKMKDREKMKGPILCLVGPPGVGKTSMGRSIARAMGRKFSIISLGGIRDEAAIRGHRRTYIGALPGRIIQALKQAGSNNPVLMLDEIDKIGTDFHGDPASALLEVLDPSQNDHFTDHYLGVPFDLSNIMFIATANQMDPVSPPLRDRMEVIELSGYTPEEKKQICRNFILPRQLKEHGLSARSLTLTSTGIDHMISHYTYEAGVRNLEREVAHVLRKVARRMAEGKTRKCRVDPTAIRRYLGVPKYLPESGALKDEIGIATGLAWTAAGGDILRVEATVMPGRGKLMLTGHLGDVMKESAHAALSYVRSRAKSFFLSPAVFSKNDIHIHVPSGAVPKDGPSAGITMTAALVSACVHIPLCKDVAMTGEITLRGIVLPIGGLKEKILAAKRAQMKTVILPKKNEKDIPDIPKTLLTGLQLVFADHMDEVLKIALTAPVGKKQDRLASKPVKKARLVSRLPITKKPDGVPLYVRAETDP